MPTDLRAALREAAAALASEAANKRATIHAAVFGDALPSRYDAIAARLRALADASPTVAELLPMVDAWHEARWTAFDDAETEVRARIGRDGGGNDVICVEWRLNDGAWEECQVYVADLTQHARLVEVTP